MDYVEFYKELIEQSGTEVEFVFANDPCVILNYTKNVLNCDIHTRERTRRILHAAGAEKVFGMYEVTREPRNGSGYTPPVRPVGF